jgi:hypothetical protein
LLLLTFCWRTVVGVCRQTLLFRSHSRLTEANKYFGLVKNELPFASNTCHWFQS